MAQAVERAIRERRHLIAEAGTGVGKSFAYLIPAILAAQQSSVSEEKKKRVIVSTHTISLQEQLINHDVPFLRSVLRLNFRQCWSKVAAIISAAKAPESCSKNESRVFVC